MCMLHEHPMVAFGLKLLDPFDEASLAMAETRSFGRAQTVDLLTAPCVRSLRKTTRFDDEPGLLNTLFEKLNRDRSRRYGTDGHVTNPADLLGGRRRTRTRRPRAAPTTAQGRQAARPGRRTGSAIRRNGWRLDSHTF